MKPYSGRRGLEKGGTRRGPLRGWLARPAFLALIPLFLAACSSTPAATSSSSGGGGGGGSTASEPTFYIITFFTKNCAFCTTVENGAKQAGKDLHVNVRIVEPGDVTAQVQNPAMEAAIAAHPQGIAFPYFTKANQPAVLDAVTAGIPVVLYNNNRFEESGGDPSTVTTDPRITSLAFIGQDETISGATLTKAMLPDLKPGGNYVIFDPAPTSSVNTLRGNAIAATLAANGMHYVVLDGTLDKVQNTATFGAYLTAHPNINGVFGSGDPTADAASKVLQQRGIHMPVGTFDVDSEAINNIQNGWMTAAINQQPYLQGYGAIMDLYFKAVLGLIPVNINTGTQIVTKANVASLSASIAAGRN